LLLSAIIIVIISAAITPAFAWFWPILGFNNTCNGYPILGFKPVPGTLAWQNYPDSGRAQTVLPGVAYCPSAQHLGFGFSPGNFGPPDTSWKTAPASAVQNPQTG
jgi:hypothetical protein